MPHPASTIVAAAVTAVVLTGARPLLAQTGSLLQGKAAFGDWHADSPGTRRLITSNDLPAPDPAESARNFVRSVARTDTQKPNVPKGFEVGLFASGVDTPPPVFARRTDQVRVGRLELQCRRWES